MVKTKPTKHKGENTFKFQTFAERLSAVNVDIVHRLDLKRNTVPDETETFFYECLEKWADLNCTEGYTLFCKKLGRDVQSLGQLLLHEDRITDLLLEHIDKDNVLYLEPILELVIAVAKDLQSNFYPKFEVFFKRLVDLLQTRDPQVTEWTFTALAYLYKTLWRLLVKNISKVYELLLPLLASDKPEHIQHFACESFAFIGRKVTDPSGFIDLIFTKLSQRPEDRLGVGQLLFQLVKGVKNQFHTSLETFLPIWFKSLAALNGALIKDDAIFQAVEHCFLLMARHTSPAHCSRVWKLLLAAISSAPKPKVLGLLLLLLQWVSYREGELVMDSTNVANVLAALLKEPELTEDEQESVSKATATLMTSTKVSLPLEQTSRLGNLMYATRWKPQIVLDFTLAVASHGLFESHLLPHYTTFCHSMGKLGRPEQAQVLHSLARLVSLKQPIPKCGNDVDSSQVYPVEFSFAARKAPNVKTVPQIIQSILESSVEDAVSEDFHLYVNALVCLPHVRPMDSAKAATLLSGIVRQIAELVDGSSSDEPKTKRARRKAPRPTDFIERLGFVLSLALLGIRHFSSLREDVPWSVVKCIFINESTSQNVFYLRAADFYFTSLFGSGDDELFSTDMLTQLYDVMGQNIYSPFREVRLLTLHILSLFSPPMPTPPENVRPPPLFQICLDAEMVVAGVTEQREKMKHLQNLEAERVVYSLPVGGHFARVPLQYLLSQLYVNFRPLWEPVMVLIESHASSMDQAQFWSVYLPFADRLRHWQSEDLRDPSTEVDHLNLGIASQRLDVFNTRCLVWKGISRFGQATERQAAVIVPRFLDFWRDEYSIADGTVAQVQDLTKSQEREEVVKKEKGNMIQLLSSYLSVIASFKRPQKMPREPEVTPILLRLLSHRSGDIQKLALDCLSNYNYPFMTPYKENLYRLVDDKSFRSELVSFAIDSSSSTIQTDHRPGLTPIILRILYGKMMHKAGPSSTGKDNIKYRQSLILRFIAGFSDSEIDVFLDLAFQLFRNFVETEDVYEHVLRTMAEADPSRALPLKRIEGALVLMGTIFSKLGNLMTSTLPKLLNILLSIFAHVMGLLARREECEGRHKSQFKNLRTLCMQRMTQFFTKFERYPWSAKEVEAAFHVCVWPLVELLPDQALTGPTPLMRLFQVWSEIPRYFVLFGKAHPQRPELNVLVPMLDLLAGGKAHSSVTSFIMEIVERLVTTADYGSPDEDEKEEPIYIRPDFCVEFHPAEDADVNDARPNFGSTILIPHLMPVLTHLRKVLSHGISNRDLNVLMRVSEFVAEAQLSSELARLIIPAIKNVSSRSRTSSPVEEKLVRYLNTLANLMQSANKPQDFIGILAPLFGSIEGALARQSLCKVLEVICQRDPGQAPLGELVSSLNAWDKQRVDQPDYNHRLATHKQINAVLEKETPAPEWTALVLYNSFLFIRTEEDISLRDNASFTLQQMTAAFARLKYGKAVLNDHFLPQLRLLLRSPKEEVRHEGVSILGKAVVNCGALNAGLESMKRLRKSDDAEGDFFENSRHLQTHRRSRALLRLTAILKGDKEAMSGETITNYLIPLATCYMFSEEYEKHNHLVDAALECLHAVARCLSWHNYEKLLRFYLSNMTRQMEFQKQAVKAVVAILNAFHFDLTSSTYKSFYRAKAAAAEGTDAPVTIETETEVPKDVVQEDGHEELELSQPELVMEHQEEEEKPVIDSDMATRIHSVISQSLLPELNRILTSRSKREMQHKSAKQDHFPEDDEILRVPIALALVNLLKNLPAGALDRSLPGMFSKVVTFLKSRSNVIRETARDTLIQMMVSLGPQYLSALMDAASPILQRGFQVHVYIYTMHAILVKMGETGHLKPACLDDVVSPLVELCKKELYGDTADEKEVAQIVNKLKEAKGVKAYSTLQILAKHVSQTCLLQIVLPMKEILASTKSFKMTKKVEECLYNVAAGLNNNPGLALEPLLIFVHGVVSLSIPQLQLPAPKVVEDPFTTPSGRPLRTDSLVIAPVPKRKVAAAAQPSVAGLSKSAYFTNSHIVVEFGLLLLSYLLKRDKCRDSSENNTVMPMLDPIIPVAYKSLSDPHSKLVALSLRCICTLIRMPIPSVAEYAPKISSSIFTLLHKYAGTTAGENFEMVETAFKAISILIRHVPSHTIDTDQLRVLLTYAEQALFDPKQQSIAFGVLKAILRRKLTLEELPDVMMRVAELSIKSEAVPVRAQSRKVVLQYMIDYPLGKKVLRYLEFFLGQLDYETETGRLSAIEFLVSVFNAFPKNLLSQQCSLFLITMSPHLINETSTSCVKAIAAALRTLIQQLNTPTATNLFDICMTWLRDSNVSHKRLAVQLCGIFVAAEGARFEFRMKELLPELIKLLDKPHSELEDRDGDLLLIQAHYAIIKMAQHCPLGLQNADNIELTDELWVKIIHHLTHPHLWIRTLSARLVGTLLGWHKAEELAAYYSNPTEGTARTYFLCPDLASRLRSLASDSVAQLQSEQLDNQLADQVVKNLVFMGKVAIRMPQSSNEEQDVKSKPPTLPWLTGKLRREINAEVVLRPKIPIKRLTVFKWMAAVAVDLNKVAGKEGLIAMLKFFVPPITREINDDGAPEEVKNLCQEINELLKGMVGTEAYSEALIAANRVLAVRRRERHAVRKAENVTRPEKAAQLRIKKQFAKRVAKKVKIARLKGVRPKLKDLAIKKR